MLACSRLAFNNVAHIDVGNSDVPLGLGWSRELGSHSGYREHPVLSHPEPLLKPFFIHKMRALSSCHMNLAYWAGAEMGSDQRWPGGVLQSQVVIQEECSLKMSWGCIFSSQLWIHLTEVPGLKKNLNCQSGRWCGR